MNPFNSDYILSNKRHGWIDYDRGISIILVGYRHCYETLENSGINLKAFPLLEYINVFLFGFRMPLFFIASGIFVSAGIRKRGLAGYSNIRVQNILYPLMVWGIIQISLQILFSSYTNSEMGPISYFNLLIDPREIAQFWYLNALFFVGIIYAVLKVKLKFKVLHQILVGLALYFGVAYIRSAGGDWGFLMDIFEFYIFFATGDFISQFMLGEKSAKIFTSWKTVVSLLIAFICIQLYFTQVNMAAKSNYYVEHHMPMFFLLVALVGCALSISVSFSLKKYEALPFLRVIGYHSVHIYCMQIIAMSVTRMVLIKVLGITYAPVLVIIVLIAGLLLPMIIYNVCLRLNMWWLFSLKKPEEDLKYLLAKKVVVSG